MRQVFSQWLSSFEYAVIARRQSRSLLWLAFCHYRSPLSRLDRFHDLRVRISWNLMLPSYGAESVTWLHVLGLRKFWTLVPHEIVGIQFESHKKRFRYWWYVA